MRDDERTDATLDLAIVPTTSWYESDDERWLAQVSELRTALAAEAGGLQSPPMTPGTKGIGEVLGPLVVALTGPSVLRAVIDVLDQFLSNHSHRTIELAWVDLDGSQQTLTVSGTGMRSAEVEHALTKALTVTRPR